MYIAGALVGAILFAACGDDEPAAESTVATTAAAATTSTAAATTTAAPESTETAGSVDGTDTPGDEPQRIVSISPTATEMLFAIGAGGQVIAVDDQSNYPPEAEPVMTDLSSFEPNVEAIAGYEPDLVVTSGNPGLTEQLGSLDIEVWEGPAAVTFGDAYAQIEQLGAITGHVAEAAELVANMQTDIEEIAGTIPPTEVPLTVYHELDDTLFSVTSSTFIGEVYSTLGLQNIADQVEGDTGGYPQLSAEFVISADPDLIFLADTKCCGQNLETVAARPGWADMQAVVDGNVFAMDDDIASRWGPRVVDYAQAVADAVSEALVPAGG